MRFRRKFGRNCLVCPELWFASYGMDNWATIDLKPRIAFRVSAPPHRPQPTHVINARLMDGNRKHGPPGGCAHRMKRRATLTWLRAGNMEISALLFYKKPHMCVCLDGVCVCVQKCLFGRRVMI